MRILHVAPAAFSRAASRIPAVESILLATFVHCCLVIFGTRPICEGWWPEPLRRLLPRVGDGQTTFIVIVVFWHGRDIGAIPMWMMGVDPLSVAPRALPFREGEVCFVACGVN